MSPIRCFPRQEFEKILTNAGLVKTEEVYKGERKWKTPNKKTIWISDITDSEALTQSNMKNILAQVAALGIDTGPPPFYSWGI
jgi:hypothetical protein